MKFALKDGRFTNDKRLDRIYEQDLRSLHYLIGPFRLSDGNWRKPRSYTYRLLTWLDQGQEGACVGFGICHELAAVPAAVIGVIAAFARRLYFAIQREDPWEGGAYPGAQPFYEGTSVLTGMKVAMRLGFYNGYRWALDARQVAEGLGYDGPCILGLPWKRGMFNTDSTGFIHATGPTEGGHCIVAVGVKIVWKSWINRFVSRTWENVDFDKSYIVLHNSWGPQWGEQGKAKLSLTDLDKLMNEQGEAAFPSRNARIRSVDQVELTA